MVRPDACRVDHQREGDGRRFLITLCCLSHFFCLFLFSPSAPAAVSLSLSPLSSVFLTKRKVFIKGRFFQALRGILGAALPVIEVQALDTHFSWLIPHSLHDCRTQGDQWRVHRKALNPAFRSEALRTVADAVFEPQSTRLVKKWKGLLAKSGKGEAMVCSFTYAYLSDTSSLLWFSLSAVCVFTCSG